MERYMVISVAAVIAIAAAVYLIRELLLLIGGERKNAEISAAKEIKPKVYVHTLTFEHNGKTVRQDDKTGYSQPFEIGEELEIVCSRKNPSRFEYSSQLRKNAIISGILLIMAVLIVLRFAFFVDTGELEEDITMAIFGLNWR